MANNRKTQGEIDKLLKKISEGMEVYEEVYDKFAEAPNQALKERFEGDLKKEIKKLQRLREQIKTLVASPEVKDKKALETARRRIEEKMEAFKVCERETKTKAFSKEGLANAKNDSADTPVARTESWIKGAISELKEQIETLEFEIQSEGSKKKKKDDARDTHLYRLKFNVLKLEQLLRLVINEELVPEEVDEIEDDVQRYIDENNEEEFEEDASLYDRFDLPDVVVKATADESSDEEAAAPVAAAPPPAKKPPSSATVQAATAAPKPLPKKDEGGRVVVPARAADTPPSSGSASQLKPATAEIKTPLTPASVKGPAGAAQTSSKKPAEAPADKAAAPLPAASHTTAASTATAPASAQSAKATSPQASNNNNNNNKPAPNAATSDKAPAASSSSAPKPALKPSAASLPQPHAPSVLRDEPLLDDGNGLLDDDMDEANDDTFGGDALPANNNASLAEMAMATKELLYDQEWDKGRGGGASTTSSQQQHNKQQQQQFASTTTSATSAASPVQASQSASQQQRAQSATAPSSQASSNLVSPQLSTQQQQTGGGGSSAATASAWSALLKAQQPSEERLQILRMLEMSAANLPHAHDVERLKPFTPPNPYKTPAFYPQTVHPGFSSPELFKRFDADTLFFIFYYQQQTYQQYLAAKELKRQAFRYHKKFKTWFQRHDKPKQKTEEFESGAYLYFDYENGWCQRIKNDFVFKYQYLEDELA